MTALTRWARPGVPAVLLVFGALFPLIFTSQLVGFYAVLTMIYLGVAVSWNMFSGYSGYISLGGAVFFGSGAYLVALLANHQNWHGWAVFATFPLGGLLGAAIAVPFGLVALRVRRHTFVVITIAFFFIFQLAAYDLPFTNGNGGMTPPFWNPPNYNDPFYYVAFVVAVLAIALSWRVRHSRFGLQLLAIRDDEDRARGLGVHAMRVKLTALVLSAFFAGLLGGVWMYFIGQALPDTAYDPNFDLLIALMVFLGGFGTLWGPVIGALILFPLNEYIVQTYTGFLSEIILGCIFLLVILFLPRGLLPTGAEWVTKLRARLQRRGQAPPGALAPEAAPVPGPLGEQAGMPSTGGVR
jgi:branched-chain amino acid transport system permease protein